MSRVTEAERRRIVAYLREGKSQGWVARELKRGKATISRVASAEGIDSERSATKKAAEARRDYAQAERLVLLNEGFDKAREILANVGLADDLKDWAVAVGTLIDKRRLEDGEATNRTENVDRASRERIKGTLDELAERRRMAGRSH
jgi:hypothetical protein